MYSIDFLAQFSGDALAPSLLAAIVESEKKPDARIPVAALGSTERLAFARYEDGKLDWLEWDRARSEWVKAEQGSGWAGENGEWLNELLASDRELSWYVGTEALPGLGFRVQGEGRDTVLWAFPVSTREPVRGTP
jgi:hypothetical protein